VIVIETNGLRLTSCTVQTTTMNNTWTSFLPACLFFPCWLLVGSREGIFAEAISTYYPMMIGMVIGSMIAGSTPLGGGIIAFPVSVTILKFQSSSGRDFSLMIQSFGMSAASFMIFYRKNHLIRDFSDLLCWFELFSIVGLVIGMGPVSAVIDPFVTDVVFTTLVICLVFLFIYEDYLIRRFLADAAEDEDEAEKVEEAEGAQDKITSNGTQDHDHHARRPSLMEITWEQDVAAPDKGKCKQIMVHYVLLPVFAIVGGILSSQLGSGSDIAFYLYGSILNATSDKKMNGNSLTAISVIVMATMSVFGSLLRITVVGDADNLVNREVYMCLFATAPIVIMGAPTGSLFLKPEYEKYLKGLFYFLGFANLIVFGLLKIKDHAGAWAVIGGCMAFTLLVIAGHYILSFHVKDHSHDEIVVTTSGRRSTHRPSLLGGNI